MVKNGSCHCGAVKFTAELAEPLRGVRCDCSICAMKGAVMVGTSLDGLTVLEGADKLTEYRFHSGIAKHYFCAVCGSYTFHQRRSDPSTYGINAACLGLNPYHDFPDVIVSDGINHVGDTGTARAAGRMRFELNGK